MDNNTLAQQASALRDFFASVNDADLREAATGISRQFGMALRDDTDWRGVEYDFNRLFVGPAAVPAPPYASAYETEPVLMGKTTMEVRQAFGALGLEVPDRNCTPDDHLAFELDAVSALAAIGEEDPAAAEIRGWFIQDHMGDWVPRFASAVRQQPDVSEPVRMAVDALTKWLDSAQAETAGSSAARGDSQPGAEQR